MWFEHTVESAGVVPVDVARARADTPGCEHVTHFNNAGAGLAPQPVLDAVVDHLRREAEIGGYEAAAERRDRIEHTYDALAALLGCDRDEVAVVENATRAWDMAFYAFRFGPGDRILTARAEYASNYIAMMQVAERTGAVIEVIPDDEHGQVDVAALAGMLDERVKLVSLVHVPTQGGLVNPAAAVGQLTRQAGVPLLLDACQSAGQIPLDVRAIGCDVLTGTGRKFLRGPRGTGLHVRAPRPDRTARAAAARPARRRVARRRQLPDPAGRAPVRELGDELRVEDRARRGGGLRARRSASTRSRSASTRLAPSCASGSPRSMA